MEKSQNILQDKSYAFSLKVIKVSKELLARHEFILSKQVIRSSTSIGAMVEEAIGSQSQKDFYHKISIAYKEARETRYWIRLLLDSDYIKKTIATELLSDLEEIIRILGSTRTTMKRKLNIAD